MVVYVQAGINYRKNNIDKVHKYSSADKPFLSQICAALTDQITKIYC